MKKYKYKISNLDCPNCAKKIEDYLNTKNEFKNVLINFNKLTIMFETNIDDAKNKIEKEAKKIESEIVFLELNEEENEKNKIFIQIFRLILGVLIWIVSIFVKENIFHYILMFLSYFILLFKCIKNSIKLLLSSKTINENFLITISCFGAFILKEYHEGLMVIILYEIGKILELLSVNNSRKSIANIIELSPLYAYLKIGDKIVKQDIKNVKIDDVIIIKKGEKVPLDGIIINGDTKLNTSAITGESKLLKAHAKDFVLSGFINEGNAIEVKVTKDYENSTAKKIYDLVENATNRKSKTENFVSKAAKIYTPLVIIISFVSFIIFKIIGLPNNIAVYRSLSFLVVSCPCAIAISVPLGYFTGIGVASKLGILIKGSDYLDNIRKINKIIFDKTGTLTTGVEEDYKLEIKNSKYSKEEIIEYYVKGEMYSNHPVAKTIIRIFNINVNIDDIKKYREYEGLGIEYYVNNKRVMIGSSKFMKLKNNDSKIYLKVNSEIISSIEIIDKVKKEARYVIECLKNMNIDVMMLTGDDEKVAIDIGRKIGIEDVKAKLLPTDKYKILEEQLNNNVGNIAFVGDGINDSPSIKLADIGISMGNIGSSAAIEASDVVIVNDNLNGILNAIYISKYTNKIIRQNLIFSLGIKLIVMALCSFGIVGMSIAVLADTGVTVLAILNTTRILKKYKINK